MGQIAAVLAEAKLMTARHGSPFLGYLIETALIQCVHEEEALEQAKASPSPPRRNADDRTRTAP